MSLAALSTVTIALAVFGGSLFGLYRLHQFVAAQPTQFQIAVFLSVELPRSGVAEIERQVRGIPGVSDVSLVTKEAALAELCEQDRQRGTQVVAALAGANPLPDRLDVHVTAPERSPEVATALKDRRRFPGIECVRDERDVLETLLATSRLVRNVGGTVAILLFLATGVVIQNTLRLTVLARKNEIAVMRLVGAAPSFIRMPLILEGVFYGVAGGIIAAAVVQFAASQSSRYIGKFQTPIAQGLPPAPGVGTVFALLAASGLALGIVTSVLSVRRFLK